jgi:hypothetical protein
MIKPQRSPGIDSVISGTSMSISGKSNSGNKSNKKDEP